MSIVNLWAEEEPFEVYVRKEKTRKYIKSVTDKFSLETTEILPFDFEQNDLFFKNADFFCFLYKLDPEPISKLEAARLFEAVFIDWDNLGKWKLKSFRLFVSEGLLEVIEIDGLNFYKLTEKSKELCESFINLSFQIPYVCDSFKSKLLGVKLETKKDYVNFRDLLQKHIQFVAAYIYYNKKRYSQVFEINEENINPEIFYFRLDYRLIREYYFELKEMLRIIDNKLKKQKGEIDAIIDKSPLLGADHFLKEIDQFYYNSLGLYTRELYGPEYILEANKRNSSFFTNDKRSEN